MSNLATQEREEEEEEEEKEEEEEDEFSYFEVIIKPACLPAFFVASRQKYRVMKMCYLKRLMNFYCWYTMTYTKIKVGKHEGKERRRLKLKGEMAI